MSPFCENRTCLQNKVIRSTQSQRVFRHPQLINSGAFMLKYVNIIRCPRPKNTHQKYYHHSESSASSTIICIIVFSYEFPQTLKSLNSKKLCRRFHRVSSKKTDSYFTLLAFVSASLLSFVRKIKD